MDTILLLKKIGYLINKCMLYIALAFFWIKILKQTISRSDLNEAYPPKDHTALIKQWSLSSLSK